MTRHLPLTLGALLLAGCTVGPDFTPPDAKPPAVWHDVAQHPEAPAEDARVGTEADPDPRWWLAFKDDELTSLIDRATKGNLDLQTAVLRIAEARSGEISAAAAGLPTLSAKGGYTREQFGFKGLAAENSGAFPTGNNQAVSGILNQVSKPIDLYQGALDASWELDLFGKVRRSVEAAGAETEQAIGQRDDALVTLQAEVAQTYVRLRGAQASRATAEADIAAEREVLTLTQDRAQHGLVSALDVETATAQVRTTEAQLPQYEQEIATSLNGLAILLGEPPGTVDAELTTAAAVPPVPPEVPVGLPASLARRRPDIREAEAKLHEETADVGVAVAQLYPDISLTGEVGQRAERAGDLAHWANNFYSFGPSISLPIFQGGRLTANVEMAKTEQQEAAVAYRKSVLSALEDVENALVSYRTEQAHERALAAALAADESALSLARDRYLHGLSTFIDVLSAENSLEQAHQQAIASTVAVTTDLVTLYKSLGGGWQAQEPSGGPSAS